MTATAHTSFPVVREAVASFPDRAHFRRAVSALLAAGFEPTDLSVIRPSSDPELTLVTCYPTHAVGPAPQRLIVVAKMTPDTVDASARAVRHLFLSRIGAKTDPPLE